VSNKVSPETLNLSRVTFKVSPLSNKLSRTVRSVTLNLSPKGGIKSSPRDFYFEPLHLYYDEEVFEILYNLSVGLERLIKIAVILIEHDENLDQDEFEKSLISHNHLDLLKRVRKKYTLTIAGPHNDFLALLSTFYKTHRYGRYSISSVSPSSQEKKLFHSYLEKQLRVEIKDEFPFNITANDDKFRKFIGNIVGKIATNLFEIISKEALRLNIYTNEIRYNSKAAKIFLAKKFEFTEENVLWKELLIYFMNTDDVSGYLDFIKSIEPLGFDHSLVRDYLQCFSSDEKKIGYFCTTPQKGKIRISLS
jgi:hypothetical protein